MQGFGDPLFRNVTTPFPPNPPYIPREYNPTGSYRKTFNIPASWKGKEIFLRMEKTASASFVWINGKEVGYNEGAQEPAEYNITKYLKPGKILLLLMFINILMDIILRIRITGDWQGSLMMYGFLPPASPYFRLVCHN